MGLVIKGATTIKGRTTIGATALPVVSQNFLTNQTAPVWLDYSAQLANGMIYDSTGKLTYGPNNVLLQSNNFSNAAWSQTFGTAAQNVTDPFGVANNAWTITTAGGYQFVSPTVTTIASLQNTSRVVIAYYVKAGTNSFAFIQAGTGAAAAKASYFNLSNGTVGTKNQIVAGSPTNNIADETITSVGNGWYRISVTSSAAAGTAFTYCNAGFCDADGNRVATAGRTGYQYGGTVSAVTYETTPRTLDNVITGATAYFGPRFGYDPATLAAQGLLFEDTRTNIALRSGEMSNAAWIGSGVTKSTDSTLSPDGVTVAGKFTANAGAGVHAVYQTNTTTTSAQNYSLSAYVKAGTSQYVYICLSSAASINFNITAIFNLTGTGTTTATQTAVGSSGGTIVSTSQTSVGGGWYRVSLTGSIAKTDVIPAVGIAGAATGNVIDVSGNATFTAAGTETIYANFIQQELGAFASSYMPSAASAGGRFFDTPKFTGFGAQLLQSATGSAIIESSPMSQVNDTPLTFNRSSPFTRIALGSSTTYVYINSTTITTATIGGGASGLTANTRFAFGWDSAGNSLVANNGTVAANATTLSGVATSQYLGAFDANGAAIGGYIRGISIYNQRLSDSVLQAKSAVGAAY